ncbi:MAG: ribosomal RNA large subunit methyltransferase H [Candidatus Sericytochromatia bacterium]|nr:MAG: ribosomal RNA large subunit methyltransferase H [Candidatus Sericytochromatia bacterium]
MKIKIIVLGKIKEEYFKIAINEYSKRLSKFCNIEFIELQDEKVKEYSYENNIIKYKEFIKIEKVLNKNSFIISLDEKGKNLNSIEFSNLIKNTFFNYKEISFIIGSSVGLHENLIKISNFKLSLSKMTLTHQMVRLFLIEQIYRSFKIINNEPYHK